MRCAEMKPWTRMNRKTLAQSAWLSLHADECQLPDGHVVSPWYVIEERDWVHVAAINAQGHILLTRQYRYAAGVIASELPCGIIEPGESPLDAAHRELKEETGHVAREWAQVAVLFNNPARHTNRLYCFVARDLTHVASQVLDHTEQIVWEFAAPDELMRRIRTGDFCQALHVATCFLALQWLAAGKA